MRLRHGDAPLCRQLAVAAAVLLPLFFWWLQRIHPVAPCLLRSIGGWPCPTCGGTRALVSLAQGRPLAALADNPLVTVGVAAVAVWATAGVVTTLVPRWRRRLEASPGDRRRLVIAALASLAVSWLWVALHGESR